jgi:hypothetical protein
VTLISANISYYYANMKPYRTLRRSHLCES